jgi:hypothetical protein
MKTVIMHVSTCVEDSGELIFDYNTREREENDNFKTFSINLPLPANDQVFYFIHKSLNRYEDKFIYVERRK